MPRDFKCGLCKNTKNGSLKTKIIFIDSNFDINSDQWCQICLYKIIRICKMSIMDKATRQQVMDHFNIEI